MSQPRRWSCGTQWSIRTLMVDLDTNVASMWCAVCATRHRIPFTACKSLFLNSVRLGQTGQIPIAPRNGPAPMVVISTDGAVKMADGRSVTKAALNPSPQGTPITPAILLSAPTEPPVQVPEPGTRKVKATPRAPKPAGRPAITAPRSAPNRPKHPTRGAKRHLTNVAVTPYRRPHDGVSSGVHVGPPRLVFAPPVPTAQERWRAMRTHEGRSRGLFLRPYWPHRCVGPGRMQLQRRLLGRAVKERRRLQWALERQQDDLRHAFAKCVRRLDDLPEGEKWEERAALVLRAENLGRALDPPQRVPAHLTETRVQFLRRQWDIRDDLIREVLRKISQRTAQLLRGMVPKHPQQNATAQAAYFARMSRLLEESKSRPLIPLGARLQPPRPPTP